MSRQTATAARRATCPACGKTGAHAIVAYQARMFLDLECSCGARWRADRATGRLIARLTTV